jgi:hypothetical protein
MLENQSHQIRAKTERDELAAKNRAFNWQRRCIVGYGWRKGAARDEVAGKFMTLEAQFLICLIIAKK